MMREPDLILATDLDGTFLHPDNHHSAYTLYSLLKSHQPRVRLIYVTGRAYESVMPLLEDSAFPSPDYIIADVGATILKKHGNNYVPLTGC